MHDVLCAVREDGTSPASVLFKSLEDLEWPDRENAHPDDYQTRDRSRLLALIERLSDTGHLPTGSYNYLHQDMWEFRVDDVRLSFYDTDGGGSWSPKRVEYAYAVGYNRNMPVLPELDVQIRLGHSFQKTDQKAPPADVQEAYQVRMEDLRHDQ